MSAFNRAQNLLQNWVQDLPKARDGSRVRDYEGFRTLRQRRARREVFGGIIRQRRIRREKEFYTKLSSESGVHDLEILRAMVAANLPDDPYWLVSLQTGNGATAETTRGHRVDDRTGIVLPGPA